MSMTQKEVSYTDVVIIWARRDNSDLTADTYGPRIISFRWKTEKVPQHTQAATLRQTCELMLVLWHNLYSVGVRCPKMHLGLVYLRQRRRYMFSPARTPAFVCLSICLCARLLKKACMDLDEMLRVDRCRDMDELLTFEPDLDHSLDAGTGLLPSISYWLRNFAALPSL